MGRAQDEQEAAHRAHLRELTTARQAAERRRAALRGGDVEARRAADRALRAELARLDTEHQAWLHERLPADDPAGEHHGPRSGRAVPPS